MPKITFIVFIIIGLLALVAYPIGLMLFLSSLDDQPLAYVIGIGLYIIIFSPNILMIVLIPEIILRRLSYWYFLIPVLTYGGYYTQYFDKKFQFPRAEKIIFEENKQVLEKFQNVNIEQYDIVLGRHISGKDLIKLHPQKTFYELKYLKNEKRLQAYRFISLGDCNEYKNSPKTENFLEMYPASIEVQKQPYEGCVLVTQEEPEKPVLDISSIHNQERKFSSLSLSVWKIIFKTPDGNIFPYQLAYDFNPPDVLPLSFQHKYEQKMVRTIPDIEKYENNHKEARAFMIDFILRSREDNFPFHIKPLSEKVISKTFKPF